MSSKRANPVMRSAAWRISLEGTVHQLHTITDSLAHDLRSPLTAIRGKLETALSADLQVNQAEPIVSAIDELDRLTEVLNTSLDVAEAKANALRLSCTEIDLDELVRGMVDLYKPCMDDKGLHVQIHSAGSTTVLADASLLPRVITNVLDNEVNICPHPAPSGFCFALRETWRR